MLCLISLNHLLDVPGAYFHWMAQGSRVNIEPDESSRLRILTDLGALDSGAKLKNGNIDVVVLTEDSDQKLLKTLMASSGAEEERGTFLNLIFIFLFIFFFKFYFICYLFFISEYFQKFFNF